MLDAFASLICSKLFQHKYLSPNKQTDNYVCILCTQTHFNVYTREPEITVVHQKFLTITTIINLL